MDRSNWEDDDDNNNIHVAISGGTKTIGLEDFKPGRQLKIISFNARSINNKFLGIRNATHKIDPEFLCIQETWGRNANTDYSVRGYHAPVFKTRKYNNMNAGGGVAIWVRQDISYERVTSPFFYKEIETIAIRIPKFNLLIIYIYRGFGDIYKHMKLLDDYMQTLLSKCKNDVLVVKN